MSPITVMSDWGYWDQLDGTDIKDRTAMRIEWPDGTVTEERVRLEKGSFTYMDMGHEGELYSDTDSYIIRFRL